MNRRDFFRLTGAVALAGVVGVDAESVTDVVAGVAWGEKVVPLQYGQVYSVDFTQENFPLLYALGMGEITITKDWQIEQG